MRVHRVALSNGRMREHVSTSSIILFRIMMFLRGYWCISPLQVILQHRGCLLFALVNVILSDGGGYLDYFQTRWFYVRLFVFKQLVVKGEGC